MSRWRCTCGYIVDNVINGYSDKCPQCLCGDSYDPDFANLSCDEADELWDKQELKEALDKCLADTKKRKAAASELPEGEES